ncbi:MAG: hypothetical protein A3J55_01965 [Candidatus Ryanbacteria bacterium RIFCSPHIGHO2_02_FULL_45_17b]|uniref:Thymidylate synthase n=1 Tax=Candidatus Ryanbacteria bacterium RIFCSPHIGHO2_01_FULL_45_22 TaxID=1802114 RepID=A0A1G2G2R2_9BACT|nr:MAG: hypothetical protein A2719_04100 [Candidatus Ryanbacteria bacterium RIFCSPHIGHO2_01_FULL_45_22]OGZ47665.1 MAG: hypothetical protein A3J55_01965 [Candidatus Ryanbacteria bacterium RIFCSPHIGHO2_02_FULL_45_17b]
MDSKHTKQYEPPFKPEQWSERDRRYLAPFATNIDGIVHVLHNLPPEIVGALCSRASRAKGSLLRILLNEYIYPILEGDDTQLAKELDYLVEFLTKHGFKNILNNQRAQGFYAKWLSQYGDDSIAQMTGTHVLFWGISQVAMKFLEDQRVGLEPIEKSTRYVNFGEKINGRYLYYTPMPDLKRLGLLLEYKKVLDGLFETYNILIPQFTQWLKEHYDEKDAVLEKKAFDTLRGLLPMATVGQVAFRGNAQAFEYLINRTRFHELGELRWIAQTIKQELDTEIPSLLLRSEEEKSVTYQEHLSSIDTDVQEALPRHIQKLLSKPATASKPTVALVEHDRNLEEKCIAGILYGLPDTHTSWKVILDSVHRMPEKTQAHILETFFTNRNERWYKLGRAFENAYVRFDIVMDIGAYRDIHRHRMLTQDRQLFSIHHGYSIPSEITEAGMASMYTKALDSVMPLFKKLERENPLLAQYVVPLAYRVQFYQWQNVASLFWETELRTGPQGHPDYRHIEQEKYRLFAKKFPRIARFMKVDMNQYSFARRGDTERIATKELELKKKLRKK